MPTIALGTQAPFDVSRIQAGDHLVSVLVRDALDGPATYGVIVLPGSGCAGLAPIAERYFRALRRARVAVIHKPFVDVNAWPAPAVCSDSFVKWDNLRDWTWTASAVANKVVAQHLAGLPIVVVGVSEGGEISPRVAAQVPGITALVLLSSSGLDPAQLALMVAEQTGTLASWQRIVRSASGSSPGDRIIGGRSLLYWRVLLQWRVKDQLAVSTLPLLQAWGGRDSSVPQQAFMEFAEARFAMSAGSYCPMTWPSADHGLQDGDIDHIQDVWRSVEFRQRTGQWLCQK